MKVFKSLILLQRIRGIHAGKVMSFCFRNYNFGRAVDGASYIFHCDPYGCFLLFGIYHTVLAWHENLGWCIIRKHTYFKSCCLNKHKTKQQDMYAHSELNNFAKTE